MNIESGYHEEYLWNMAAMDGSLKLPTHEEVLNDGRPDSLCFASNVDPSELLASLDDHISKAKEEAFSRKEIMEKVEKWMSACEEESWLEDYSRDIEFTVQENRLWMLQCRSGKCAGTGAVKIAVDMVKEGLTDGRSTIKMVEPRHLDQLLHPQFKDPSSYKDSVIATGLPASPGAAIGQIVFNVEAWHAQEIAVILVWNETSPEDVGGMHVATGILTARGGMTSHAAVFAHGWGKCCISGCSDIRVNENEKTLTVRKYVLREGDWISMNGTTGEVI